MKKIIHNLGIAAAAGVLSVVVSLTYAQAAIESTTTTTTTRGTVSTFTPDTIVVKSESSPTPVRYSYSKTTTYVDEMGNPVSIETVKSGSPVTVYYDRNGDRMVATKVVVRRTTTAPGAVQSITTSQSPTPPSITGIVSDSGSDAISIRTESSAIPMKYKSKDATAYVEENGNPIAKSSIREGTPVTIFYERSGDNLVATRVVVRTAALDPSTRVIEEKHTETIER
jgi:hypothetical protein